MLAGRSGPEKTRQLISASPLCILIEAATSITTLYWSNRQHCLLGDAGIFPLGHHWERHKRKSAKENSLDCGETVSLLGVMSSDPGTAWMNIVHNN